MYMYFDHLLQYGYKCIVMLPVANKLVTISKGVLYGQLALFCAENTGVEYPFSLLFNLAH